MKTTFPSIITTVTASLVVLATAAKAGPCTNTVSNTLDSGPGSLRDALANATNFETITFCPTVTGTIVLTNGELVVTNSVTILGPGPGLLAVNGNSASRVFHIYPNNLVVTISGLTITNGSAGVSPGGGIYNDHATTTVSNCTISGNSAGSAGAIYNDGTSAGNATMKLVNSTVSGNSATYTTGGIYNDGSLGGSAALTLVNSTVSGNSASGQYGGIYNDGSSSGSAMATVLNSTFSGNSDGGDVGAFYNDGTFSGSATLKIGGTILKTGTSGVNLGNNAGTVTSLGYNLSSDDGDGFLAATGDQINTDPMLGPLQNNGGPTPTHALLGNSPAIDAGTNFSGLATDQRGTGFARTVDISFVTNAPGGDGTDIGAFEVQTAEYPVPPGFSSTNSTTFLSGAFNTFTVVATGRPPPTVQKTGALPAGVSLSSGGVLSGAPPAGSSGVYPLTLLASNGVPSVATQYFTLTVVAGATNIVVENTNDSGPGSLRAALTNRANLQTITFSPSVTGRISLASGQLVVSNGVTILGPGANVLAIDGKGSDRVFYISPGATVTIAGLTITNGSPAGSDGGGIYNDHATTTVSNCTLIANSARLGGGVYSDGTGGGSPTLGLINCTVSGNSASYYGGGIYIYGYTGSATTTVLDSTFSSNSAPFNAGGIYNDGHSGSATLTLVNCTISANSTAGQGGGVYSDGSDTGDATVKVINSTFNGNSDGGSGGAFFNEANSGGSGSATLKIGSTILKTGASGVNLFNDAGTVTSLGYNLSSDDGGGFLTATGDKVNTDPKLGPLQDNGGPALTHALLSGSPAIDAGTNFSGLATDQRGTGFARTVDFKTIPKVADGTDIGAFEVQALVTTNADSGLGSLRQVAGALQGGATVTFAANLSGQTITLASGEIAITNNLTIDASALPNGLIINGNHNSRIFNIGGGTAVTLNALVLTNGYTTNGNWGGAIFNAGTLALNYCTLAGNSGDSSVAGGAIANQGPLTALGCIFSGNSAGFSGAIDNRSTCTLQNSAFYGNVAFAGNGGAIDNSFSATLSILQCTFSANSASSSGGAIDNYQAQVNVTNSILSGNSGQDVYNWSGSTIDAGGANIIPAVGNAGTLVGGGTISSANPLLGAPANNGGRTLTMMPQSGSPAINAGVTSLAAGLAYDQRGPGYPRVVGSAVDIGAFEVQAAVGTAMLLTGSQKALNGPFQFSFTNTPGASFTVLTTTNIALPLSNWTVLGAPAEISPGNFQYSDPQATNQPKGFYRVRSP